ncbi:hypothetical protein O9992_19365 [Vibrio lentus]|nr:hypothetical protein [Vibrio lentus]
MWSLLNYSFMALFLQSSELPQEAVLLGLYRNYGVCINNRNGANTVELEVIWKMHAWN